MRGKHLVKLYWIIWLIMVNVCKLWKVSFSTSCGSPERFHVMQPHGSHKQQTPNLYWQFKIVEEWTFIRILLTNNQRPAMLHMMEIPCFGVFSQKVDLPDLFSWQSNSNRHHFRGHYSGSTSWLSFYRQLLSKTNNSSPPPVLSADRWKVWSEKIAPCA